MISCSYEDAGRFVEYRPAHGDVQIGRIVSKNDQWVFVIYDRHMYCDDWQNYSGVATSARDLHWFKA
jgi:hypothetical protein